MSVDVLRFGRTESWTSGWRGKASATPIYKGKKKIGEISGQEGALASDMRYFVECNGLAPHEFFSLQEAKAYIRANRDRMES